MKKFSEFTNENKLETSKSKVDYISNLVEESLYVENDIILGKDTLVETLNNIIIMNDHKNTINVLENIKAITYKGGLDFAWLNETIENEKNKIENILLEKVKKDDCDDEDDCDDDKDCKKGEDCDDKDCKEEDNCDEKDEEKDDKKKDEEDEKVKESVFYQSYKEQHMLEIDSLNDIYKNILKENKKEN